MAQWQDVWPHQSIMLIAIVGIAIGGVFGGVYGGDNAIQILGFSGTIVALLMNAMQTKQVAIEAKSAAGDAKVAAVNAGKAAVMVQENAVQTDQQLERLKVDVADTLKMGETNHTLLNSARGELLEALLKSAETVAELRGGPADLEAVVLARKRLQEHEAGQRVVDRAAGKPPVMPPGTRGGRMAEAAHAEIVADAQETAKDAQETAKDAQAVAKTLTEEAT